MPEPSAPGVHVGRDGWLFWTGRSGEVLKLYDDDLSSRWRTFRWRRLVEARDRRCAALGAEFRQAIVPDKLSCLGPETGRPTLDPARSPGRRLGAALRDRRSARSWVDLFGAFGRQDEGEESLFLRTDTHLTASGYLAVYRTLCAACGAQPLERVLRSGTVPFTFAGDIGGKLCPAVGETYGLIALEPSAERVEANDLLRLREGRPIADAPGLLRGSRAVFRTAAPDADPRTVVLFGDSYTFIAGGLSGLLAETFREVHAIWSERIDWDYVDRVRPALVIHEMAERFMRRVPRDRFRVDAFAAERVAKAEAALRAAA